MSSHASKTSNNWRNDRQGTPEVAALRPSVDQPSRSTKYQKIGKIPVKDLVPGIVIMAPLHTADFSDNEGKPYALPADKFRTLSGLGTWIYSKFRMFILLRKYHPRHAILIPIFTHDYKGLVGKPMDEYIGVRDDSTVGEARTCTHSPHMNIFVQRTPEVHALNPHVKAVTDTAYAQITSPTFWAMNNPAEINGYLRPDDLVYLKKLFAAKLLEDDQNTAEKTPSEPATATEGSHAVPATETEGISTAISHESQEVPESGDADSPVEAPGPPIGHGGPPASPPRTTGERWGVGRGFPTRGGYTNSEIGSNSPLNSPQGYSSDSGRIDSSHGRGDFEKWRGGWRRGQGHGVRRGSRGSGRGRGTGRLDPVAASSNTGEEVPEDTEHQRGFEWSMESSGLEKLKSMSAVEEQRNNHEYEVVKSVTKKRKTDASEEYSEDSGVEMKKPKRLRDE